MKNLSSLKTTLKAACFSIGALATMTISNCGGGSSGSTTVTIRPQSLNGTIMRLPSNVAVFEFVRSRSSNIAERNGSVETGSILYSSFDQDRDFITLTGANVEIFFPTNLTQLTYRFIAINDNQAELQITGQGASYGFDTDGLAPDDRPSDFLWFLFPRNGEVAGNPPTTILLNLTFESSGSIITGINNVLISPQNIATGTIDILGDTPTQVAEITAQTEMSFRLRTGGLVTTSFQGDPNIRSLANTTLDNRTLRLTPSNTTLDFSAGSALTQREETGTYLIRQAGATQPGTGTYTYRVEEDSDNAILTLSGGSSLDGTITLTFTALEGSNQSAAGTVTGAGADTSFTLSRPSL